MNKTTRIPVWTYWEGQSMLPVVLDCLRSWKQYMDPDKYEIHVLTPTTLAAHHLALPANFNTLPCPAVRADVVRLNLLVKYGGIWMDASIFLTESLDWIEEYADKSPLVSFRYLNQTAPECWFLYVPRTGTYVIEQWRDAFQRLLTTTPMNAHPAYGMANMQLGYHMIYDAWMWLLSSDTQFKTDADRCTLLHRDVLYSRNIPLASHDKLAKLTRADRLSYSTLRYPMIYVWIVLAVCGVAAVATAVAMAVVVRRVK
jgi:hypothetical protein